MNSVAFRVTMARLAPFRVQLDIGLAFQAGKVAMGRAHSDRGEEGRALEGEGARETYRQLAQSGINGVSIVEVSRTSGISNTTISGTGPSRSPLLIDACSRLGSVPEAPDTGSIQADLSALLERLSDQLQTVNWSSVYHSIIDAAERDPEIEAMQANLHKSFMAPFEAVIERAKSKGEISSDRITSDLVAALIGPMFFRRWFSKETIGKLFIRTIIENSIR
ncbi:TetR-like C-terminal domain-containing protein [Bradyrhizobium sp. BWA-3-5]|uniref:TetR-like C-terminal domain-containing protein n=1 Tax=Bradyrhizobium sp. BWA-3-5 TaxID=3080013 RepID=UPI00293E5D98|nr:TetR-like C-terminal domain-containing protein [Bradyrhizobium sp. BWA-3-5]WOH63726.1 TetR-like C-terminal domain-containing protein [Bradyrhizobium sp. BWA-3-5]